MFGGLFGNRRRGFDPMREPHAMQGQPQSIPREAMQQSGKPMGGMIGSQARRPGLGTRLFGEGWEGRASALGSMLMGDTTAIPAYHANQQAQQQALMAAADAQRQAAMERKTDWQDWQMRQDYQRANPAPVVRENNMGDVVSIDPVTGEARTLYEDPYVPTVVGPDGRFYPMQLQPRRPVGNITPIDAPPRQAEPSMIITPRELDALVNRYGPQEVQRRLDAGIVAVRSN